MVWPGIAPSSPDNVTVMLNFSPITALSGAVIVNSDDFLFTV